MLSKGLNLETMGRYEVRNLGAQFPDMALSLGRTLVYACAVADFSNRSVEAILSQPYENYYKNIQHHRDYVGCRLDTCQLSTT